MNLGTLPPRARMGQRAKNQFRPVGWLLSRLMSSSSRKIGYIGDKVLSGDLVLPG